jgi:hypothetical protein
MTKQSYDALSIPPAARKQGGIEVLRAAVVHPNLALSVRRSFDDPRAWGVLLATVALQVSRIYATELGLDEKDTRAQIRAAFESDLDSPGDVGTITATR